MQHHGPEPSQSLQVAAAGTPILVIHGSKRVVDADNRTLRGVSTSTASEVCLSDPGEVDSENMVTQAGLRTDTSSDGYGEDVWHREEYSYVDSCFGSCSEVREIYIGKFKVLAVWMS